MSEDGAIPFADRRVAILTGRSDPALTGLSSAQAAFLAAVCPPGVEPCASGYPWTPEALPERPVPLALATWRNSRQWRAARRDPAFGTALRARIAVLRQASGQLALVTGSCGLDMLAAGWTVSDGPEVLVLALGPVTSVRPGLPGARVLTVVGARDILSVLCHRCAADHAVPCGHMGYWTCPETRRAVSGRLAAHFGRLP